MREKNNTPLSKLLKDKDALHWLRKHGPEFDLDSYRGGKQAFNCKINPEIEVFADKLQLVKDRLPSMYQTYAEYYLNDPPRNVAKKTGIPIKEIYRRYERLRQLVAEEYLAYKAEQVGKRIGKVDLDTEPKHCCIASRTLEYRGQIRHCYLVSPRGHDQVWVDADAMQYPLDVQDLLFLLHEQELGEINVK